MTCNDTARLITEMCKSSCKLAFAVTQHGLLLQLHAEHLERLQQFNSVHSTMLLSYLQAGRHEQAARNPGIASAKLPQLQLSERTCLCQA